MSITAIDPKTALIVVDVQKGIVAMTGAEDGERVVTNTATLANAFHQAGLPVIWVIAHGLPAGRTANQRPGGGEPPADFTVLDPRLPVDRADLQIKKVGLSAFTSPETHSHLQKHGITGVVVTGIATGMGVESAARSAFDLGYNVTIVTDAVADSYTERGESALAHTLPGVAELGTTAEVVAALTSQPTQA